MTTPAGEAEYVKAAVRVALVMRRRGVPVAGA